MANDVRIPHDPQARWHARSSLQDLSNDVKAGGLVYGARACARDLESLENPPPWYNSFQRGGYPHTNFTTLSLVFLSSVSIQSICRTMSIGRRSRLWQSIAPLLHIGLGAASQHSTSYYRAFFLSL